MSSSKTKNQKLQLPFLLRALGFIDEDFASPTAPSQPDNQLFNMERAKSPVRITAQNFNSLNAKVRPEDTTLVEFAELKTTADVQKHYKRIMSSSFPWKKLDDVVKFGHKEREINDLELEEWKYLFALGEKRGKEFEKNEIAMRQLLNDVMLWGMAVQTVSGEVKEMEKVVDGFGIKTLSLWFEEIEIPFLLKK